jgi:hypothetical protein
MTTMPAAPGLISYDGDFEVLTIEHLGVKLYQNRPTNVIAEFVSNSWDADATRVDILLGYEESAPTIAIIDNGRGMTRSELTDEFLIIGRNRRPNPKDKTSGGRFPMGRKGIGKLAGFGIAKTVDIISIPNPNLREGANKLSQLAYWLRFELPSIVAAAPTAALSGYDPIVIGDGITIETLEAKLTEHNARDAFEKLVANAKVGQGGVGVFLHDTSLKKAINRDGLLQSLAARFTVTMLRPDFKVEVNGAGIKAADAFPAFLNFGFGSVEDPITETIQVGGDLREIKYWVKFVALQDTDWPIENAGIGVYAHGKIAQDRPFFFGVRGKDIYSRYIYGVVEADWLDETPDDVVSTDRRTIDWADDATAPLHEWGAKKFAHWIAEFRKWRASISKDEVVQRIRSVAPTELLSGPEEDALATLLTEVLPSFGNDEEAKNRTAVSLTSAWTHAPTRQLTQTLWKRVFADGEIEPAAFAELVESLRSSQVPEAMGLAVTMAQRIAAITSMRRMIEQEKTETHLQRLIEQFPWLLGPQWEKLTANQTIKTLVLQKYKPESHALELSLAKSPAALKPDFVFLSDVGAEKELVIFELKGPECGKTLQPDEYMQLRAYLDVLEGAYPNLVIKGILVGHDKCGFRQTDNRIEVTRWADVLGSARSLHVSYLGALLKASEPGANDARLKQIADFGGKETIELLKRLAPLGGFDEILSGTLFNDLPNIGGTAK